jgi:hypothetical protein
MYTVVVFRLLSTLLFVLCTGNTQQGCFTLKCFLLYGRHAPVFTLYMYLCSHNVHVYVHIMYVSVFP